MNIKQLFILLFILTLFSCRQKNHTAPRAINTMMTDAAVVAEAEKLRGVYPFSDSAIVLLEKHQTLDSQYLAALYSLVEASLNGRAYRAVYFAHKLVEAAIVLNDSCYMNKGMFFTGWSYNLAGLSDSAIYYYEKASDLSIAACDHNYAVEASNCTGDIYYRMGKYKQALDYHKKAYQSLTGTDHVFEAFYNRIAFDYEQLGDFNMTINWGRKGFQLASLKKDTVELVKSLSSLSVPYRKLNEWDSAAYYSTLLYDIATSANDTSGLGAVLDELARIEYHKGNMKEALGYEQRTLAITLKVADFHDASDDSRFLSQLYEKSGNFNQALLYQRMAEQYNDSCLIQQNSEEVITTQNKARFDQQMQAVQHENELQQLASANQLSSQRKQKYFFEAGALLLLLLSVFIYRNFVNQRKAKERIAKEEQRSKELLLNILPSEVAEELKEKGSANARLFDDVTVLFTDFKDFTKVSEHLTPQKLVDELNTCFSAFDHIISKYNIEKIKTVGDAYLAVSGLPLPSTHHATDVVNAAIEIRDFMLARKGRELETKGEGSNFETFEVRVGVHSGSVVAGIVGVKKFAYDIWGDTVNTAARMEQNGEAGKINISETTYELVRDKITCEYRGEIDAKNKGTLKMYFVQ